MQLYRAAFPVARSSDFAQLAWSIIYGIFIVAIVRMIDTALPGLSLQSQHAGFPPTPFIAALYGGGIGLGAFLVLVHRLRFWLSRHYPFLRNIAPDPQRIWVSVADRSNTNWATVFLSDGAIYLGWISKYTFNPDAVDQDFLLSNARRVDEQLSELYRVTGIGVYINTRDVKRIEFVEGDPKPNDVTAEA